jgi:hypothetical protein
LTDPFRGDQGDEELAAKLARGTGFMGIDINALKFLTSAAALGVDFTRTMMIGRQRLYVSADDLARWLSPAGSGANAESGSNEQYAEWVFRRLGASTVDSVDAADYEGATVIHDLNLPLPERLHGRYSAVVEGGTLEHIFNFPSAIRSCMDLTEVGGRLICCTVANNYCGHGFYQFSPELFFRVLTPDNGFVIERLLACDGFRELAWYRAQAPETVRRRVEIVGPYPVMLLVQARKVTAVQAFRAFPQQTDYVDVWTGAVDRHADHSGAAPQLAGW